MFRFVAALALAVVALSFVATTEAAPIKVGAPMPTFASLDTTDGKSVSVGDLKKDVVVVCITCNHCPVAVAYEDRLIEFAKKHAAKDGKCEFIAINVNNSDQDKLDAMKIRAKEKGFNFTYAYDPSQKIARELGASKTPEFFVFNKGKLIYTGAMDDSQNKPTTCYITKSVEAALSGSKAPECTEARGCGIKFEKTNK